MRILFYNWVDYLDARGRGGGVSTYQRNVMEAFGAIEGVEPVFLSAGMSYDLRGKAPRWAPIRTGPETDRDRRFELINAAPLAPGHASFGAAEQLSHPPTVAAFADFVAANGPFDVIHFNNLEGLPADVLALRGQLPNTKFILSLHNYYPFCSQVNLWFMERSHCSDFHQGRACIDCVPPGHGATAQRGGRAATAALERAGLPPGSFGHERVAMPALRVAAGLAKRVRRRARPAPADRPALARAFAQRREEMVRLIGANCDAVLCVSESVARIAAGFGLPRSKLHVSYIGTDHANRYDRTEPQLTLPGADGTIRLAYLGYARKDKGFFFLLNALGKLPSEHARRVHVLLAAAGSATQEIYDRLALLRSHLASLIPLDGYDRTALDALLEGIDLGVVPVLWEDALPQVALEMHARHIPLLTSDRGGAQELGCSADLTFVAGDTGSFADRIAAVLEGQIDLAAYWANARRPATMADHIEDLLHLYRG